MAKLAGLLAREPPELELSIVELDGGELSFGMVLRRGEDSAGRYADISAHGGWRAYRQAR
jgi:hypothetical protein